MKTILSLILSTACTYASAIDFIIPFAAGGSSSQQMQVMVPELAAQGININPQFLPNCQTQQAMRGSRPMLLMLNNDSECSVPTRFNEDTFVALMVHQPLYLCGKKPNLSDYSTGNPRLAINTKLHTQLANTIREKINVSTKIINYTNSSQVRTAMKTSEVELSLTTVGPIMVAEGVATCYAVAADQAINGIPALKTIIGESADAVTSLYSVIVADGLSPAEVIKYRTAIQQVMQGNTYRDLIVNKQKRELPVSDVKKQITFVNNVNRGAGN